MDYSRIAEELSVARETLSDLQFRSVRTNDDINSILANINSLDEQKLHDIRKEEMMAREKEIEESTSILNDSISKFTDEKSQLIEEREERLNEVTEDVIREKVGKEFPVEEYLEKCKELKDSLIDKVGKNFIERTSPYIPIYSTGFSTIENISEAFDSIDDSLKKMSGNGNFLERIEEFIFPSKDENKEEKSEDDKFQNYATITFGILILMSLVIFPITFIPLAFLCGLNVYKSYKFYHCMVLLNTIVPNIDKIKAGIDSSVELAIDSEKNKIRKIYGNKIFEVEEKVSSLNNKVSEKIAEINRVFYFNPSNIDELYKVKLSSLEQSLEVTKSNLANIKTRIAEVSNQISDLEEQLKIVISQLREKYYPTIVADVSTLGYNFPNDLLLNLPKDEDDEPEFFDLTKSPYLIAYDNIEDAYDFIRLLLLHTYLTVNHKSFRFTISEFKYMATFFVDFEKFDNFQILNSVEEQNILLKDTLVDTFKRRSLVGKEDLRTVNDRLFEDESTTHQCKVFIDFCEEPLEISEDKKSIIRNGSKLGIHYFLLFPIDKMRDKSEKIDKFRGDEVTFRLLRDGSVVKRKFSAFYSN